MSSLALPSGLLGGSGRGIRHGLEVLVEPGFAQALPLSRAVEPSRAHRATKFQMLCDRASSSGPSFFQCGSRLPVGWDLGGRPVNGLRLLDVEVGGGYRPGRFIGAHLAPPRQKLNHEQRIVLSGDGRPRRWRTEACGGGACHSHRTVPLEPAPRQLSTSTAHGRPRLDGGTV